VDTAIELLQCTNDELGEPGQLEAFGIQPAATPARHLGEEPTQMDPHIQQDEGQCNQHEAVGGVIGSGPPSGATSATIAAFNAVWPW
jgi:hypothetical protein